MYACLPDRRKLCDRIHFQVGIFLYDLKRGFDLAQIGYQYISEDVKAVAVIMTPSFLEYELVYK